MRSFIQSNRTKSTVQDVLSAIVNPSVMVNIDNIDTSLLHYHINEEKIEVGTTMRYFLVSGFSRVVWSAKVISFENNIIKTSFAKGPFTEFIAVHSIVEEENGCIIRDFIEFKTTSEDFARNLESCFVNLNLEADNPTVEKVTGKIPLLDIESMA